MKGQGNAAFSAGNYEESIKHFSVAIELDPENHILWSNRSASYASLRQFEQALDDADRSVSLKGDWSKGHGRRGAALIGLGRFADARSAYNRAVELDPENLQLKKGLETAERMLKEMGDQYRPIENPFSDPLLWEKLKGDPKMADYLKDPEFVKIIDEIRADPKSLTKHITDPRVTRAFATMLGVDIDVKSPRNDENSATAATAAATASATASSTKVTPVDSKAMEEKELGNEAYKRRDFEGALGHYNAAIELDPENISLLTNKSAVYFEMGEYEECIALCEEAVQRGRDTYADFKLIAKALGRIGSAYEKKGDLEKALEYYQRSLTDHRTADILNKMKEVERTIEANRKRAYHNPEIAEQERNSGNELFKKGEYVEAIKHYTEAIKRDERDPRAYSNRAACYMKLTAVPEGLKDCDKAISLDPTFVKAHIRRAHLLHLRRDYTEAMNALEDATKQDHEHRHTGEIQNLMSRCYTDMRGPAGESEEETMKRAMQNPEVREILTDPVMMQILRQMQSDPRAISEHLQNPSVAQKLRKLVAAGIIKTG